jgi:hypothetical protein
MTIDTRADVTVARSDITAGQSEREPSHQYVLQTVSGEILPVLKVALVELNLGRSALRICVLVTKIKDECTLGLYVLRACEKAVDLKHNKCIWAKNMCHYSVLELECDPAS